MTIRRNIGLRRPNFPIGHRKEPIRQEKKEEVDQSGNVKVAHSGVKSESNRYLKVSEINPLSAARCHGGSLAGGHGAAAWVLSMV